VIKLSVDTIEEFEQYLKDNDLQIAKTIIKVIEENLSTKKRFIPVFEIEVVLENDVLDITLDRKNFITTLETNLLILERHEQYENCSNILNLINQLKIKSIINEAE